MASYSTITCHNEQTVCNITLNRTKVHNAFNQQVIEELNHAISNANQDDSIRLITLSANGRHFCAGADLTWMQAQAKNSIEENKQDALELANLLKTLANSPKATIALAHGRVMGGGCGLLACCDLVIASENAEFCFSEVKLGLIPATISPYVIRKLGFQATQRYFLTAELFDAEQAKQLNLVNEIVKSDQLTNACQYLANIILKNSPNAITATKQLLDKLSPIEDQLIEETASLLANIRASNEAQHGLQAFFEKQTPDWAKDL